MLLLWEAAGSPPSVTDSEVGLQALLAFDSDALLVADVSGALVGSLIAAWDGVARKLLQARGRSRPATRGDRHGAATRGRAPPTGVRRDPAHCDRRGQRRGCDQLLASRWLYETARPDAVRAAH